MTPHHACLCMHFSCLGWPGVAGPQLHYTTHPAAVPAVPAVQLYDLMGLRAIVLPRDDLPAVSSGWGKSECGLQRTRVQVTHPVEQWDRHQLECAFDTWPGLLPLKQHSIVFHPRSLTLFLQDEAEELAAQACYIVREAACSLWECVEGRSKDYIAAPKPNGYQSLHSTMRCVSGSALLGGCSSGRFAAAGNLQRGASLC